MNMTEVKMMMMRAAGQMSIKMARTRGMDLQRNMSRSVQMRREQRIPRQVVIAYMFVLVCVSLAGTGVFIFPRRPRQTVRRCAANSMVQQTLMPTDDVRHSRFVRVLHVYGGRARHTLLLAAL